MLQQGGEAGIRIGQRGAQPSSFKTASLLVGVTPRGPSTTGSGLGSVESPCTTPLSSQGRSPHARDGGRSRDLVLGTENSQTSPRRQSLSLVKAMKGMEPGKKACHAYASNDQGSSDSDSDGQHSTCSAHSNLSALSTVTGSQRTKHSSCSSAGSGSRSTHLSFSECSIDIEQQHSSDPSRLSLCGDFRQLCNERGSGDGLMQCLDMYGYQKPNKLQQHAIPAILHHLGKQLGGKTSSAGHGKGCVIIQGPKQSGKTSSVVLSILLAIDVGIPQPQAILLSASKRDLDKYLNIFTLMDSITYEAFFLDEEENGGQGGQQTPMKEFTPAALKAARAAHILIGHPRRMLKLLDSAPDLNLDSVRALVVDDAEELLYSGLAPPSSEAAFPFMEGSNLGDIVPGTEPSAALPGEDSSREQSRSQGQTLASGQAETLASTPRSSSPLLDDIVQICDVLECRQYSQNMSTTWKIRSGQEPGARIRYLILTQNLSDPASRKVLRLLKNSLMKKKNLLSQVSGPPPTKLIKAMKHYFAEASRSNWVRIFAGLVQSLMFPRALIFCDDTDITKFYREMQDMGIRVSANLPVTGGNEAEARRKAVQEFTSNKSQFLLTPSHPAICSIVLPKVSCVFHFGSPAPALYGCRLQTLDPTLVKEIASIFFVDGASGPAGSSPHTTTRTTPQIVATTGKFFDIRFMEMPFEFLPSSDSPKRSSRHNKTLF
mmetsp:Transcript_46105/g.98493  ORF Transcript_46105/g.98493 Transcript_46105/m.98493 type:complete len:715 (+) Transcript_46105:92-2236(+)